ncbi:MAG: hypothetical protein GY910_24100 [bacterium]|nr:hypothetical protein [bacterium]
MHSGVVSALRRADAFFLSDALRSEGANEVAGTRIGLFLCLATGAGALAVLRLKCSNWPASINLTTTLVAFTIVILPFALRQTRAIRSLG